MDEDYIFRRELDLQTTIPEMIVHLKNGCNQEKGTVR